MSYKQSVTRSDMNLNYIRSVKIMGMGLTTKSTARSVPRTFTFLMPSNFICDLIILFARQVLPLIWKKLKVHLFLSREKLFCYRNSEVQRNHITQKKAEICEKQIYKLHIQLMYCLQLVCRNQKSFQSKLFHIKKEKKKN